MKLATIVGARPQFIKAATVSRAIGETPALREILIHTGQHYDANMSKVFFDELRLPRPDYNLGIGGGHHGAQTGQMLIEIEKVLLHEKPDAVLVYGDTNSTLAGALAAAKLHIPLAHVEAGLRSFNKKMPEEQNRILTDHLADLLFAPTKTATDNLLHEGRPPENIHTVGDVMYDAVRYYAALAANSTVLQRHGLNEKNYVLATIHRAENTDDPATLEKIMHDLTRLANEIPVVLPLHPRTRKMLAAIEGSPGQAKITLIDPVGYLDMLMLEKNARLVITDSGGVQKEAYFHGVPCLTMRNETEWVELVQLGYNRLFRPGDDIIAAYEAMQATVITTSTLYGTGDAALKVREAIESQLS